jgi:drug/metabolite transporter (DMT)-like permease
VAGVAGLAFLGGGVTLGAFGLYNWALSRIPASRDAAFINLVSVVAVAAGWLLMGEPLTPLQCLAALAVAGGVGLSQMR